MYEFPRFLVAKVLTDIPGPEGIVQGSVMEISSYRLP